MLVSIRLCYPFYIILINLLYNMYVALYDMPLNEMQGKTFDMYKHLFHLKQ